MNHLSATTAELKSQWPTVMKMKTC